MTSPAASGPVTPRAAKIRAVLATLLVCANEVVSVDSLIDELWGENPPRTATTTLQVYISQLRKMLQAFDPEFGRGTLVTRPPGYALHLDPAHLDLTVFEELHHSGREALLRRDHAAAADLQRRALALWRAPLASDTPHGALLARTAVRLAETRSAALEQRVRAELQLGRHLDLVAELRSIVAEMPMREEFHALLMVALYRSGRQADALHVFAQLRRALVEELAIEPGSRIQQLHQRILAGDGELLRSPAVPAPATAPAAAVVVTGPAVPGGPGTQQLPARDPAFAGRTEDLDRLGVLLRDVPAGGCVAVAGAAGVGKTALAVAAAHELDARFPDGRVFVELTDPDLASPAGALAELLRRLGVSGPLPSDLGELRSLLRRSTEGRRVLLVLDGSGCAELIRPLLPATSGSTALVTCRRVPAGLTARVLELNVLPPDEARDLFIAAAGRRLPLRGAEAQVREVAELCGGLPLALRAAAARLASRPHWGPKMLAARLRDERRRLPELTAAAPGFHDRLRSSYEEAPPDLRRAFRLLGLLPAGPFDPRTAAAVLGENPAETGAVLRELVEARLLHRVADGPTRGTHHRLHDLWRLLARECLADETPQPASRAATARMADGFTEQALAANSAAEVAGLPALEWFALHQDGLVDVVRACHAAGLWAQTVRLADAMTGLLEARAAWEAWEACHGPALDAARRLEDLAAEARLLRSLGDLAWQRRELTAAAEYYEGALLTADAAPALAERGRALVGLADLQLDTGGFEGAAALLSPALDAVGGHPRGRYEAHRALGLLALETGRPAEAEGHFTQCLDAAGTLGDTRLESFARRCLSRARGAACAPAGWTELRPGVWRLAAA
ncbi:BTAD domain-containing putative transcriptional regulator [Streptomyces fuscichromogenes]|uniref:AfsR/SARP family transcriptional regulator n=1 Tax=Streptomyces fuscichromogenes TaxID=1324013 RepID=UPI0038124449